MLPTISMRNWQHFDTFASFLSRMFVSTVLGTTLSHSLTVLFINFEEKEKNDTI